MKIKSSPPISTPRRAIAFAIAVAPITSYFYANSVSAAAGTSPTPAIDGIRADSASSSANAAEAMNLDRFLQLSQVLTSRPSLDPIIAKRALQNLIAEDSGFNAQASALLASVVAAKFADMRAFNNFIGVHPTLRPTAMKIISAWYLGYTGTPAAMSAQDDARFVSYAGALMYEPTIDATVVPTYSRGHTNFWATPPATLATD